MTTAAVFDLDNTIVRGSSLYHFGKYLVRRRELGVGSVASFAFAQKRYRSGGGEQEAVRDRATRVGLGFVAGRRQATMARLSDEFVAGLSSRHLEPATLDELRTCQDKGIPCFVATASPQELADAFARRLCLQGAFGTVIEVVDGVYTGRLAGPACHGEAKTHRVRVGLSEQGLDLSTATAYSDSVNDLPLLVSAGTAVAVNADAELLSIAERNGWRVVEGGRDQARTVQSLLAYLPFPM